MLYDELPHVVIVQSFEAIYDDSGGFENKWVTIDTIDAFVDTPTSTEAFRAQQLETKLDRFMYYEYRDDLTADMRILFGSEVYEFAGDPMDQGGMTEKMRVPLKKVKVNENSEDNV
ncbi:phage head closure protein [Viridibacillus arvi]|uniref:phage head closure protein n=1 Tax=Viridibacillus arvi TaxID=263475 RepID=UPI003CFD7946